MDPLLPHVSFTKPTCAHMWAHRQLDAGDTRLPLPCLCWSFRCYTCWPWLSFAAWLSWACRFGAIAKELGTHEKTTVEVGEGSFLLCFMGISAFPNMFFWLWGLYQLQPKKQQLVLRLCFSIQLSMMGSLGWMCKPSGLVWKLVASKIDGWKSVPY